MKVVLDIGHTATAPGACNSTYDVCEFEFNKTLADAIIHQAQYVFNSFTKKYDITLVKVFRDNYKDLPNKINLENPDIIISLHANAFDTKVSGSEVLYYRGSTKGKFIAATLQGAIVKALQLSDRGIKGIETQDRGFYLLSKTKAPCAIVEPFFIDNDSDLVIADSRINILALNIVEAIIKIYENKSIWRN